MKEIKQTNDGYKEYKNGKWVYYVKRNCSNCNKELWKNKSGIKRYKNTFCANSYCQSEFNLKKRDFKGYNILDNIKNDDFYWLIGLIATDGTISWPHATKTATSYNCQIKLSSKDNEILYKIHKQFGGKIIEYPKDKKCVWTIKGKPFINFLRSIGFDHNKTTTLDVSDWFKKLSKTKKYAFVCGCIDGDGWIYKKRQYMGFCSSSYSFIKMISDFLNIKKIEKREKSTGYGENSIHPVYIIRLSHRKLLKPIYENMYKNRNICLNRKYKLAMEFLNENK